MEKICKKCGIKFENGASDYCSKECASNPADQMLDDEKEKLLKEIKEKANRRKTAMNPDSDTGNEYVK